MEDSDEFDAAVRVVIKRQLRDLLQQLHERGDEIAVIAVNTADGTCANFGSNFGEGFVSEQMDLETNFLQYCRKLRTKSDYRKTKCTETVVKPMTLQTPYVKKPSTQSRTKQTQSAGKTEKIATASVERSTDKGSGEAILRIKIPKAMAAATQDLPALVGDLVSSQLSVKSGKDGESATKASPVTAVGSKRTRTSISKSPQDTEQESMPTSETPVTRSRRSGRTMTSKYMEGIASLKKKSRFKTEELTDKDTDMTEGGDVSPDKVAVAESSPSNSGASEATALDEGMKDIVRQVTLATAGQDISDRQIRVELSMEGGNAKSRTVRVELRDDETNVDIDDESSDSDRELSVNEEDPDFEPKLRDIDPRIKAVIKDIAPVAGKPALVAGSERFTKAQLQNLKRKPKYRSKKDQMLVECNQCGQKITGYSNLASHKRRVHDKVRNFKCHICRKGFWSNNARESHMLSVHTRKCDECGEYVVEAVPWEDGMDMKTRRHVVCSCGAIVSIFSRFGRVRQYLRPDEPDIDGNVEETRRTNASTKYACGTCGKLFLKRANCERHSRMHTNIKVCACDLCGNQYQYDGSLAKHMVAEHGILGHVCEICGKNFKTAQSLTTHMVKYHVEHLVDGESWIVISEKNEEEKAPEPEHEQTTVIEVDGKTVQLDEHGIVLRVSESTETSMNPESTYVTNIGHHEVQIVESTPVGNGGLLDTLSQQGTEAHPVVNTGAIVTVGQHGMELPQVMSSVPPMSGHIPATRSTVNAGTLFPTRRHMPAESTQVVNTGAIVTTSRHSHGAEPQITIQVLETGANVETTNAYSDIVAENL